MSVFIKGSITYDPMIETVSGKFTTKKNKCVSRAGIHFSQNKVLPARYMGGAVRQEMRIGLGVTKKNYMFFRENPNVWAPTTEQTAQRSKFRSITQWVAAAKADLAAVVNNKSVFNTLCKNPSWYLQIGTAARGRVYADTLTYHGLLFKYASIYADENEGALPATHVLPEPTHEQSY